MKLVILLCTYLNLSLITALEWESLKIGVIYDSQHFFMPHNNLVELKRAISDLYQMIETRPIPLRERQSLSRKNINKCAPNANFGHLKMLSVSNNQIENSNVVFDNSSSINFYIVLELNGKECLNDQSLLAGAKPCFYDIKLDNRPSMARLVVCLNNQIWKHFQSGYDLFRHEILHALGFGMIYPQKEEKKAPEPKIINWRTGPYTQQSIKVNHLDFGDKTLEFTRNHFSCQKIDAIPADSYQKFHLNEYYFGNELMTPVLSDGRNYFTQISASILENTYFGNVSWYKVNRQIVEKETREYWYGNYGCEFWQQSCYEFIQSKSNSFDGSAFPFCSERDLRKTLNRDDLFICFSNKTHNIKFKATCQIDSINFEGEYFEEYDLKPIPLNVQFGKIFRKRSKKLYGSANEYRYCPMISQIFDGTFDEMPENGVVVKCPK